MSLMPMSFCKKCNRKIYAYGLTSNNLCSACQLENKLLELKSIEILPEHNHSFPETKNIASVGRFNICNKCECVIEKMASGKWYYSSFSLSDNKEIICENRIIKDIIE